MVGSMKVLAASAVAVAAVLAAAPSAKAEVIYGISFDNNLFSFDSANPTSLLSGVYVSGLQPNEFIQSIDFRPLTNELYALGSSSRVYKLNTTTGAATLDSQSPFTPQLSGTGFGGEFNPVVDRMRIQSDTDQNLRYNPTVSPGVIAVVDPNVVYTAGDPNAGTSPSLVALAYINNFAGATSTQLYAIDSNLETLATSTTAGTFHQYTTVGALTNASTGGAISVDNYTGLDVSPGGTAYLQWNVGAVARVGTINLANGQVSNISTIGGGLYVRDIAVVIPEPASLGAIGLAAFGLLARRRK